MTGSPVRRSRAFRPTAAMLNLLESRSLLTTVAFVGPLAYWTPTDQPTSTDKSVAQPILGSHAIGNDATAIAEADPSYGGGPVQLKTPVQQAIDDIANSAYAKTDDGQKVLQKIQDAYNNGKIKSGNPPGHENSRGTYTDSTGVITYNPKFDNDRGSIASELVHEAGHGVWKDKYRGMPTLRSDEEYYAIFQQLQYYKEQQGATKPTDTDENAQLVQRQKVLDDGTLKPRLQQRYGNQLSTGTSNDAYSDEDDDDFDALA